MALVLPFTHSDKAFFTYYGLFNLYCINCQSHFASLSFLNLLVYVDTKAQTGLSICLQWDKRIFLLGKLPVPMDKGPLLGK